MNDNQKCKRNFRNSKIWSAWKRLISANQKGLDFITHAKLRKYSALHHLDLNPEHYTDISNEDNFCYLNNECHKLVHYLYTYYKKDEQVIDRLKEVLDRMKCINENITN